MPEDPDFHTEHLVIEALAALEVGDEQHGVVETNG